jgi:DMSO/TMAO reductase YedYZ molybdopterin-dependent catalytic subunit
MTREDEAPIPEDAEARIRRLSRRSFLWAGLAAGGSLGGLVAFNRYAGTEDGTKTAFRRALGVNEWVARRLFFSPRRRAQEFPLSEAREPRNNYKGETPIVDQDAWRLTLDGTAAGAARTLTLADLQKLPHVSETTELKCIEGWSAVVNWTGARFADFARRYPFPPGTEYVAMLSEPEDWPDERYYVGLDLASCLHPQTLLAWAMNGRPLTAEHGAPLRLVIPHKYGIKNIKLITRIAYTPVRPADYWAEQGYDWYAGL